MSNLHWNGTHRYRTFFIKITVTKIWFEIDVVCLLTYFLQVLFPNMNGSWKQWNAYRNLNKCSNTFEILSILMTIINLPIIWLFSHRLAYPYVSLVSRKTFFFPYLPSSFFYTVPFLFYLSHSHTANKGKFRGRWRFFFDSALFFVCRISLAPFDSLRHRFTTAKYVLGCRNSKKVFFFGLSRFRGVPRKRRTIHHFTGIILPFKLFPFLETFCHWKLRID